ncbi:hypothetical protein WMF28_34185 [Sorangium sp. So ce590]|uniref:hypothetical protein n=1 Tax=Sorangium sp. So ce590 TaxID=3133317 RepID=UPI003F5DA3F9
MSESKLAVFVEGQAEQIFVRKLVEQIAGAQNVRIVSFKALGGRQGGAPRRLVAMTVERPEPLARYYVQIVECCNDDRVASDIRDNYDSLVRQQFKAIIGVRDVYPRARAEIQKIRQLVTYGQKTKPIQVSNVLAVMEVEAWFLGEHTHFAHIGTGISLADIASSLGFDPSAENMEQRDHPAKDLNDVYALGGCRYQKRGAQVQATVDALDYEHLYLSLADRMASLGELVDALNRFLAA